VALLKSRRRPDLRKIEGHARDDDNELDVEGVASNGQPFEGAISDYSFTVDRATGTLMMTGVLAGRVGDTKITDLDFTVPVKLSQASQATRALAAYVPDAVVAQQQPSSPKGGCDVFVLDIQGISLGLLGLQVDLSPITIDVGGGTGSGRLLGNLLCALLGLLSPA
jgi:hypothetical protein